MLFLFVSAIYSLDCNEVEPRYMLCLSSSNCTLDEDKEFECNVFPSVQCNGNRTFLKTFPCRYCFQQPSDSIICNKEKCEQKLQNAKETCYSTNYCIGYPVFQRMTKCRYTHKSQKTAFFLSLFLGAFGADRFYLGYKVSGAFKLLTVGGLGIVYVVDLLLIIFGFLGPSNGALFTERISE